MGAKQDLIVVMRGQITDLKAKLDTVQREIKQLKAQTAGVGATSKAAAATATTSFGVMGKAVATARTAIAGLSASLKGMMASFGAFGAVLGGAFLGRAVFGAVADFQDEMKQVQIVTQATGEEFKALREIALAMGGATLFTATQAAEALKFLGQAGLSTRESVQSLQTVLNLASGAQLELGAAAEQVAGILNGFNLAATDAVRVTDLLIAGQSNAANTVTEFSEGLAKVGPIAVNVGVSLETTTAALGVLANNMLRGSDGGTALRNVMIRLAAPAKAGRDAIRGLGLALEDVNPEKIGLTQALANLRDAGLKETGDAAAIFGTKMAAGGLVLTRNLDQVRELEDQLRSMSGATREAARAMEQTLRGQLKLLQSQLAGLILNRESGISQIGTAFIGAARLVIQAVDFISSGIVALVQLVGTLGEKMASTILTQILPAFNLWTDAMQFLLGLIPGMSRTVAEWEVTQARLTERIKIFADALGIASAATMKDLEATSESIGRHESLEEIMQRVIDGLSDKTTAQQADTVTTEAAVGAITKQDTALKALTETLTKQSTAASGASGAQLITPESVETVQQAKQTLEQLIAEQERLNDQVVLTIEEDERRFNIQQEIADATSALRKVEISDIGQVAEAGGQVLASEEAIKAARARNAELQKKVVALQKEFANVDLGGSLAQLETYDALLSATNRTTGVSVDALEDFDRISQGAGNNAVTWVERWKQGLDRGKDAVVSLKDQLDATDEILGLLKQKAEDGGVGFENLGEIADRSLAAIAEEAEAAKEGLEGLSEAGDEVASAIEGAEQAVGPLKDQLDATDEVLAILAKNAGVSAEEFGKLRDSGTEDLQAVTASAEPAAEAVSEVGKQAGDAGAGLDTAASSAGKLRESLAGLTMQQALDQIRMLRTEIQGAAGDVRQLASEFAQLEALI